MAYTFPYVKSGLDQRIKKNNWRISNRMNGLSTYATMISVLSFPIIFIVLLYPHMAGSRGKWPTVRLLAGISVGTMLIAVLSSPDPHFPAQEWGWLDWGVMAIGSGILLALIVRRYASLKKLARKQNIVKRGKSKVIRSPGVSKKW